MTPLAPTSSLNILLRAKIHEYRVCRELCKIPKDLQKLKDCGILDVVQTRKGSKRDYNGRRRILDGRGSRRPIAAIDRFDFSLPATWYPSRLQNIWSLEDQAQGLRGLSRKYQEYQTTKTRQQIEADRSQPLKSSYRASLLPESLATEGTSVRKTRSLLHSMPYDNILCKWTAWEGISMSFSFKAIETHYHGYRFRSRLEARHAVFFDTLGIAYEYEKEGYDLNGTRYLPDFWLPEMECFIEIKGQLPSQEEFAKTKLLAIYTGKPVYLMAGNIGSQQIYADFPPTLYAMRHQEQPFLHMEEKIEASAEVLAILQRLHEVGLSCESSWREPIIAQRLDTYVTNSFYPLKDYLPLFASQIQQQHDILVELTPALVEHEQSIHAALTVERGWKAIFHEHLHLAELEWCQCEGCEEFDIGHPDMDHISCTEAHKNLITNSVQLQEAYEAARSARFEFGGK